MQVIRVLSQKRVRATRESLVQALVLQTRHQREDSSVLNFTQGSAFFTIPAQEDVWAEMPNGEDTARGTGLPEFHHHDPGVWAHTSAWTWVLPSSPTTSKLIPVQPDDSSRKWPEQDFLLSTPKATVSALSSSLFSKACHLRLPKSKLQNISLNNSLTAPPLKILYFPVVAKPLISRADPKGNQACPA